MDRRDLWTEFNNQKGRDEQSGPDRHDVVDEEFEIEGESCLGGCLQCTLISDFGEGRPQMVSTRGPRLIDQVLSVRDCDQVLC